MRQIDWKNLLLMLRTRRVTTASIWRRNGISKCTLEALMYGVKEPKHCVGEVIIEAWLTSGGRREDIPYRLQQVPLKSPSVGRPNRKTPPPKPLPSGYDPLQSEVTG